MDVGTVCISNSPIDTNAFADVEVDFDVDVDVIAPLKIPS